LLTARPHVQRKLVFKVDGFAPPCVRNVLLERGWVEHAGGHLQTPEQKDAWHLHWKNAKFSPAEYDFLLSWQVINHFPKTYNISNKEKLARNLKRMKAVYGANLFDFFPRTYIMPNDYTKLIGQYTDHDTWTTYMRQRMSRSAKYSASSRSESAAASLAGSGSSHGSLKRETNGGSRSSDETTKKTKKYTWIAKPAEKSQGRGITILKDLADLRFDSAAVVQKYIETPMMISGYKFDLRLYVIVASFHPLTVYLYKEGLVRFATDKFSMDNLGNKYSHLTNTSINKQSPSYSSTKDGVGPGCIWALSQLKSYFESQPTVFKGERHPAHTWHKITNIILLTLLALSDHIPTQSYNCFELLGFDILIDSKMKPWLLEVNVSPALTTNTSLDAYVKLGVLQHTIYLCEKLFFAELEEEIFGKRGSPTRKGDSKETLTPTKKELPLSRPDVTRFHGSGFYKPKVGIFSRSRSSKNIPLQLGDLKLIFPFNEASRLATCFEKHDIRGAILEISKRDSHVQKKLRSWSAKKRNPTQQNLEKLLLWCP